jgi:hypothetical protein
MCLGNWSKELGYFVKFLLLLRVRAINTEWSGSRHRLDIPTSLTWQAAAPASATEARTALAPPRVGLRPSNETQNVVRRHQSLQRDGFMFGLAPLEEDGDTT